MHRAQRAEQSCALSTRRRVDDSFVDNGCPVNAAMLENEALHVSTVVASVFSLLQLRGYIGHCRRPVAFFDLERCCIHEDMKTPVIHTNHRDTFAPRGGKVVLRVAADAQTLLDGLL